jgi:hypothetical protein
VPFQEANANLASIESAIGFPHTSNSFDLLSRLACPAVSSSESGKFLRLGDALKST